MLIFQVLSSSVSSEYGKKKNRSNASNKLIRGEEEF